MPSALFYVVMLFCSSEMIILLVNLLPLLACVEGKAPLHEVWRDTLAPQFLLPIAPKPARAADDQSRLRRDSAQYSEVDVRQQFCSSIGTLSDVLKMDQRPLLLHTMAKGQDTLIKSDDERNITRNITIDSEIYRNFTVLSHLPVTAITILLPDLLNNFTLPDDGIPKNSSARLKTFLGSLEKLGNDLQWFDMDQEQKEVGSSIVQKVSTFVSQMLDNPDSDTQRFIMTFTANLQPDLSKAAEFALRDYFNVLDNAIQWSTDMWVVIAAEGFAYPGSFLFQYYESKFENDDPLRRIAVVDPSLCNAAINLTDFGTLQSTLSNTTFHNAINMLFDNSGVFPLHSILSEVAKKVLNQTKTPTFNQTETPTFKGFQTKAERLYVILIVALLSATIILSVMICSVYCEDKLIKMENKPVEPKRLKPPKGPSLLTPFAEKEIASSYSAFHQLRKKHMQRKRDSDETELLSPDHEAGKHKAKFARLPSESDDPLPSSSSTVDGNGHEGTSTQAHKTW